MYREHPTTAGPGTTCTWDRVVAEPAAPLIVPDGCVDLVWFSDGDLEVAGPDTGPRHATLADAVEIVGVRIGPGAARSVLGVPASAVRDQQLPLRDLGRTWEVLADRLAERAGAADLAVRRAALAAAVAALPRTGDDRVVASAVRLLEADPRLRVREVAGRVGLSSRQLQRRFDEAVGYGPKTFARVARLQRFARITGPMTSLGETAVAAGYASQSHLSDEVRALTGSTPVRFLEDRRGEAP